MRLLRLLLLAALALPSPAHAARAGRAGGGTIARPLLTRPLLMPRPLLGAVALRRAVLLSSALTRPALTRPALAATPAAAAIPAAAPAAPASPARGAEERLPEGAKAPPPETRRYLGGESTPRFPARAQLEGLGLAEAQERFARAFDGGGRARSAGGALFELRPSPDSRLPLVVRVAPGPAAAPRPVPGTGGLSGAALLEAVARAARQGPTVHDYKASSDYLFSRADAVEIGGVRGIVDGYSGVFVPGSSTEGGDFPERGDRNGDGHVDSQGMNVEHIWPQGHFDKRLPMRADLHHLMPTFIHPNSVRGNIPFGVVTGRPVYQNDAGTRSDGRVFEPADFAKGRVARAMLYFYVRYRGDNILADPSGPHWWQRQIETLLDWNRRFPPDAEERARNERVERFQGNRNPFVDDPGLADRIGAEALRPAGRGRGERRPGERRHSRRRR